MTHFKQPSFFARFNPQPHTAMVLVLLALLAWNCCVMAGDTDAEFEHSIRPILNSFCITCHSTAKHKGDLNLERFAALGELKKNAKILQGVAEQLANNDMPPPKEIQPTAAEKERLAKWVDATLNDIALAHAGDPGPVVLRRLSNAEYTYTIRDLTGVSALDPAREFPVDGAAGEGFTNTGQALVMSPSLITKYLDAGKEIAKHAILLPDGIRFSAKTTRRDRTEELLAEIRAFYSGFTDPRGGDKFNLQGVVFESNAGGRLPLEKYLAATIHSREAFMQGGEAIETAAREQGLNAKYLTTLFKTLNDRTPSLLFDDIRTQWRSAKESDVKALADSISEWQKALWKFGSVGHIGKLNGPKAWMEPVSPLVAKQEIKYKIPAPANGEDVTLYVSATSVAKQNEHDVVIWQEPRVVAPGRPPLLLRDIRAFCAERAERRERLFSSTANALNAAAETRIDSSKAEVDVLAQKHGVAPDVLNAWLRFLGMGSNGPAEIKDYFTTQTKRGGGFDFINGWGKAETPNLVANSSDKAVRIPGNMKPHSVAVHPSPKLQACVGWRAPVTASVKIDAVIQRAHPECGNGIVWFLEVRRGAVRQSLATGTIANSTAAKIGPFENISVQPGDVISVLIDPRDGNHSCDLTAVDLTITSSGEAAKKWDLAADVSPDVLAGNPHADRFSNLNVWHFYTEPIGSETQSRATIPAGSMLAAWQSTTNAQERSKLADAIQKLLMSATPPKEGPDAQLVKQLHSLAGTLLASQRSAPNASKAIAQSVEKTGVATNFYGLDPALFGHHPNGEAREAASVCVHAPSILEIRLPADVVAGAELVASATLDKQTGAEGAVQVRVATEKPAPATGVRPGAAATPANGTWNSNAQNVAFAAPIIVNEESAIRKSLIAEFDAFRDVFPAALCYTKIVPVDEVVTLTLFHREDNQLARLMLDDAQKARLDRMWNELHFVSHDALTLVDALEQLLQFASQDGDPKVFDPVREPIKQRAAEFKKALVDAEPKHVDAVLEFAERAYRRPLADSEMNELRGLYQKLRAQELAHEDAIQLVLARVLVAPAFLYRAEKPIAGAAPGALSDWELANRLSYFLWSSAPDAELRAAAANATLHRPDILVAQTQRILRDPRVRRMAVEFGCSWLHIHGFDELSEKSDRHFPTFASLRGAMYEESIQFFTDFFQNDRPVPNILDSDYAFLNDALAKHYGIPGVTGADWRRVDGVKKYARGGILAQASTLSRQSGASRTSPILRGNWVAEALLGDKLPKPPKDVPPLPEDEANEKLTVRQLVEKHSSDARCAACHKRIDAFGFSLEGFDAIGRKREKDLGDRSIDTHARTMDGAEFDGVDGLRHYLLTQRRDAFMRQFNRKLLGYALGRSVQLSDEPLLKELQTRLKQNDDRVGVAIQAIVQSSQFRNIRGRDAANDE